MPRGALLHLLGQCWSRAAVYMESVDPRRAGEDWDDDGVRGCEGVSLSSMLLPSPLVKHPGPLGIKVIGCHISLLKTANPFV